MRQLAGIDKVYAAALSWLFSNWATSREVAGVMNVCCSSKFGNKVSRE